MGETVPAAPIARSGLVFIGNAGATRAGRGDDALDARSRGNSIWSPRPKGTQSEARKELAAQ